MFNKGKSTGGWKKPDDYHVTCLFMGRDDEMTEHPIYQNFEERNQVDVEILAIIVVPGKLITGICFPKYEVDNKCPHMTLLTNEWPAKFSNDVLELCCVKGGKPFAENYQDLKERGRVKDGNEIKQCQIKLKRD